MTRPQLQASSTARSKRAKVTATEEEKKIAALVTEALGLDVAVKVLRVKLDEYKDEGRRVAKRKGLKDHRGHFVVVVDIKDTRYVIDCAEQFEYEPSRDKFIQLVGLERAATCMELLPYTHLCNLANAGQLHTPQGKAITAADIKRITKKRKRPVMKILFEKKPLMSGVHYEAAMQPPQDSSDCD